jgi:hypothetical protein
VDALITFGGGAGLRCSGWENHIVAGTHYISQTVWLTLLPYDKPAAKAQQRQLTPTVLVLFGPKNGTGHGLRIEQDDLSHL